MLIKSLRRDDWSHFPHVHFLGRSFGINTSCLAVMVTHVCGDVWIRAGNCCRHNCFAFSQCPAPLLLAGLPCSKFGLCLVYNPTFSWMGTVLRLGRRGMDWDQLPLELLLNIQSYWMQFMGSLCGEVVISQHEWCWTISDRAVVKLHFFFSKIFMAINVLLQEKN